jgi:hypothetical protein
MHPYSFHSAFDKVGEPETSLELSLLVGGLACLTQPFLFHGRAATICLALILAGLIGTVVLGAKTNVLRMTAFEKPPAILEERARNLIQSFGYAERPADSAYGFRIDADYANYSERQHHPAEFRDQLASGQPSAIQFFYRQSPQPLTPFDSLNGVVSRTDPPPIVSGMARRKALSGGLPAHGAILRFAVELHHPYLLRSAAVQTRS